VNARQIGKKTVVRNKSEANGRLCRYIMPALQTDPRTVTLVIPAAFPHHDAQEN
jgi:hypothetical protein